MDLNDYISFELYHNNYEEAKQTNQSIKVKETKHIVHRDSYKIPNDQIERNEREMKPLKERK